MVTLQTLQCRWTKSTSYGYNWLAQNLTRVVVDVETPDGPDIVAGDGTVHVLHVKELLFYFHLLVAVTADHIWRLTASEALVACHSVQPS